MRAADGVEAVLFELGQAVTPWFVRHSDPDSGVVKVQVAAFQFDLLAVEKEAFGRAELYPAHSEAAFLLVREDSVIIKADLDGVEIRVFKAPKMVRRVVGSGDGEAVLIFKGYEMVVRLDFVSFGVKRG